MNEKDTAAHGACRHVHVHLYMCTQRTPTARGTWHCPVVVVPSPASPLPFIIHSLVSAAAAYVPIKAAVTVGRSPVGRTRWNKRWSRSYATFPVRSPQYLCECECASAISSRVPAQTGEETAPSSPEALASPSSRVIMCPHQLLPRRKRPLARTVSPNAAPTSARTSPVHLAESSYDPASHGRGGMRGAQQTAAGNKHSRRHARSVSHRHTAHHRP
jgi:hypothetical protein